MYTNISNIEIVSERCRLCQLSKGTINIMDNEEFISQVFECTKIKISKDYLDIMPRNVCSSCKLSIEEFFTFLQDVRKVDQTLQDYICNCSLRKSKPYYSDGVRNLSNDAKPINVVHRATSRRPLKCFLCSKTFRKLEKLQLHKKDHLSCNICKIEFDNGTITLRNNHVCNLVSESASRKSIFTDDVKIETDSNITKDDIKTKYINDKNNLQDYNVEPPLKAEGNACFQETKKEDQNIGTYQKPKVKYCCTFENCNKICSSAYTLRTHLMKHEGKMPFLCVTCGKGFTTKNSLNCHEKTHAKVKDYICKECNTGFSVNSNLRAHQKKYHEGIRFYCSKCTRAFVTKSSLERHELVHSGIKEFKCKTCKAAFYTNKELLNHQKYHQGLRLYKCDRCFKTFFEKHHLTIHIRVHTGERPYVCKVPGCGKSFAESQKLSRHTKARHP